jgi:hypothetical protein
MPPFHNSCKWLFLCVMGRGDAYLVYRILPIQNQKFKIFPSSYQDFEIKALGSQAALFIY